MASIESVPQEGDAGIAGVKRLVVVEKNVRTVHYSSIFFSYCLITALRIQPSRIVSLMEIAKIRSEVQIRVLCTVRFQA